MKLPHRALLIIVIMCASPFVRAQKASDFYLPLSIGSHTTLSTPGSATWAPRTTTYSVEGSDLIGGITFSRVIGREDLAGNVTNIFQAVWVRKDSLGNIVLGAIGNSTNVDSAAVLTFGWFPNEFLVKGYARTYLYDSVVSQDSVLSTSATVTVPAGTFHNCLVIMTTHYDGTMTPVFREVFYYASGVGEVMDERLLPTNEAHVNSLVSYGGTNGVGGGAVGVASSYSLAQNYPNPFNPSTTIRYTLSQKAFVRLAVYDILGREVAVLVNGEQDTGNREIRFDGSGLASGVYFYRLSAGSFVQAKKLLILR